MIYEFMGDGVVVLLSDIVHLKRKHKAFHKRLFWSISDKWK